jgi:hypothetical protein
MKEIKWLVNFYLKKVGESLVKIVKDIH